MPADGLRPLLARLEAASEEDAANTLLPEQMLEALLGCNADDAVFWAEYHGCPLRSIDAAVALCERIKPGVVLHLDWGGLNDLPSYARLGQFDGRAPTPALALCVAIVRAKLAEGTRPHL